MTSSLAITSSAELGVLVLDRLDRALELGGDQVEPVERPRLEVLELLLVLDRGRSSGISRPSR